MEPTEEKSEVMEARNIKCPEMYKLSEKSELCYYVLSYMERGIQAFGRFIYPLRSWTVMTNKLWQNRYGIFKEIGFQTFLSICNKARGSQHMSKNVFKWKPSIYSQSY